MHAQLDREQESTSASASNSCWPLWQAYTRWWWDGLSTSLPPSQRTLHRTHLRRHCRSDKEPIAGSRSQSEGKFRPFSTMNFIKITVNVNRENVIMIRLPVPLPTLRHLSSAPATGWLGRVEGGGMDGGAGSLLVPAGLGASGPGGSEWRCFSPSTNFFSSWKKTNLSTLLGCDAARPDVEGITYTT